MRYLTIPVCCLALLLSGCGGDDGATTDLTQQHLSAPLLAQTIRIGLPLPLTGTNANVGLEIQRAETLAIGDQLNDLELLEWAGLGVAMGDGCPETHARADAVTGSLADEGAAQAIERYVLAG